MSLLKKLGFVVLLAVGVGGLFVSGCRNSGGDEASPGATAEGDEVATSDADATNPPADPTADEPSKDTSEKASSTATVFPVTPGEWPMWGGTPGRNMVNTLETGIAADWNIETAKNIRWRRKLGSQSYGNPVIVGGKIFIGTNNGAEHNPKITGDKGIILAVRESDGKLLWQMAHDKLEAGRVNDWPLQGICSAPVVEGDRLWYVSNRAEVICADTEGFLDGENDGVEDEKYKDPIDGDIVWRFDMIEETGVFPHNLATSSPVVVGDIVFVITSNGVERDHITIPNPRAPSFLALDKKTGEIVWANRDPGSR